MAEKRFDKKGSTFFSLPTNRNAPSVEARSQTTATVSRGLALNREFDDFFHLVRCLQSAPQSFIEACLSCDMWCPAHDLQHVGFTVTELHHPFKLKHVQKRHTETMPSASALHVDHSPIHVNTIGTVDLDQIVSAHAWCFFSTNSFYWNRCHQHHAVHWNDISEGMFVIQVIEKGIGSASCE